MEAVGPSIHTPSGLPVVSLYGTTAESLKPRREDFADLEAIVFDIADVGSRYYTYIWTMLLAMEACAASRLRFVVCDRPNPIGGAVEGAPQSTGYLTFVGLHPIPVRHGMTAGELRAALRRGAQAGSRSRRLSGRGMGAGHAVRRDRPALGVAVAEHAVAGDGARLPRDVPAGRHEPLGGARHDAAVRALRRAVAERGGAGRRPQRAGDAGRVLRSHAVPADVRQARGRRPATGALLRVVDAEVFRPFQTGLRIIETARRLAPLEFRWRTETYEFDDRPAIDLLTGSARFRETLEGNGGLRAEIARHFDAGQPFAGAPRAVSGVSGPAAGRVAFVGGHDSGKTTVLVELVPRLLARGLRVGTIKHTTRDVEDDVAGKDSQRHGTAAGAAVGALVTPASDHGASLRGRGAARSGCCAASSPTATSSSSRATRRFRFRGSRSSGRAARGPTCSSPTARISDGSVRGLGTDAVVRRLGRDRRARCFGCRARPRRRRHG